MNLMSLAGQLLGGGGQQGSGENLLSEVMNLVNSHPGGLGGLVQAFQQGGLGEALVTVRPGDGAHVRSPEWKTEGNGRNNPPGQLLF